MANLCKFDHRSGRMRRDTQNLRLSGRRLWCALRVGISRKYLVRATATIWVIGLQVALQRALLRANEPDGLAAAAAIEEAFVRAIESAEKSVVSIARDRLVRQQHFANPLIREQRAGIEDPNYVPNEFGAGVVIDEGGLILTNYHLVRGGPIEGRLDAERDQVLYVRLPDRRAFEAHIYAADPRSDLAVLKIPVAGLKPIRLGNASRCRKGQFVIALGNPYAIARDGSASASWGIISNLYRRAAVDTDRSDPDNQRMKTTLQNLGVLIQVDTRLELGTSGGALLNLQGEMVGLTTALSAIVGYEKSSGFALPIDDATRRIIDALRQGKEVEYGFLGIGLDPHDVLPSEFVGDLGAVAQRLRQFGAARVKSVVGNLPAQRAGLRSGDVVLQVGDRPVYGQVDLMREIGLLAPGDRVNLRIWRQNSPREFHGREIEVTAELGKWPAMDEDSMVISQPLRDPWRGLTYDYPTARSRLWKEPGSPKRNGGVIVTHVDENSPAAAELRAEDVVTQVRGRAIRSPREFTEAVQGEPGPVTLTVVSAAGPESERQVIVPPPR